MSVAYYNEFDKGYRVAALRGAGNAINLGTAAQFIQAAEACIAEIRASPLDGARGA